jgi:hypothetical protein
VAAKHAVLVVVRELFARADVPQRKDPDSYLAINRPGETKWGFRKKNEEIIQFVYNKMFSV